MVVDLPFWEVLALGAVGVPLGVLVQRFPWLKQTFAVINKTLIYAYLVGAVVYLVVRSYARL